MRVSIGAAAIGGVALLLGLMLRVDRVAASYVAVYTATVSTAVGALLMIMIAHLSGAVWFIPFHRTANTITAALPWLAVLAIPLVLLPSPAAGTSFVLRVGACWAVWLVIGELVLRTSRDATARQRRGRLSPSGQPVMVEQRAARLTALSAVGIPATALALTFAAFDWMMSRSPGWSSTIYGPYVCTGGVVAALAAFAVLGTRVRNGSIAAGREHFQSLGQLLLACVLLWAYLWYCQFFIVWIASLPREVPWYVMRFTSPWAGLSTTIVVIAFVIPCLTLLFRSARGSAAIMSGLGVCLIVMHYIDVYWLVVPSMRSRWVVSDLVWDLAAALFIIGSAAGVALWRRTGLTPGRADDPLLEAALRYEAP